MDRNTSKLSSHCWMGIVCLGFFLTNLVLLLSSLLSTRISFSDDCPLGRSTDISMNLSLRIFLFNLWGMVAPIRDPRDMSALGSSSDEELPESEEI